MVDTDEDFGRAVVANGELGFLREQLGLNRSSMAELLHTSVITYTSWEQRPSLRLWPNTATRIGRFVRIVRRQLDELHEAEISLVDLLPLHHVSTQLGVPQELLLRRYREGRFEAEDLGVLGLWIWREDLERIRNL